MLVGGQAGMQAVDCVGTGNRQTEFFQGSDRSHNSVCKICTCPVSDQMCLGPSNLRCSVGSVIDRDGNVVRVTL